MATNKIFLAPQLLLFPSPLWPQARHIALTESGQNLFSQQVGDLVVLGTAL